MKDGNAKKYQVGLGWKGEYGIRLSLNLEKLNLLPVDKYGNVSIDLNESKPEFSKGGSTHWLYHYTKEPIQAIENLINSFKKKNKESSEDSHWNNSNDTGF